MKLLLDPHGDDGPLFCSYTLLAQKPYVIVAHPTVPLHEIGRAYKILGCYWTYLSDERIGVEQVLAGERPEIVYAPVARKDGHSEHNEVALLGTAVVTALFPSTPISYYLTYAPRGQRDRNGTEVIPPAGAVAKKLRALSCYESQIEQESTRPWFYSLLDMREWLSE